MDPRLERFRAYMDRLNPSAMPERALDAGLYVEHPSGVGARIASHLTIHPASSHLLMGGIGSGKTTELRIAERRLREVPDMVPIYLDVARQTELRKLQPGSLLTLVGLELEKELPKERDEALVGAVKTFQDRAFGYEEAYYDDRDWEPEGPPTVRVEGIIQRPDDVWFRGSVHTLFDPLKALLRARLGENGHLVVLLDSMDRMKDLERFRVLVDQDVRALRYLKIGVALAAPQRMLYGLERSIVDQVEQLHHQPFLDVDEDPSARDFLEQILTRRTPEGMMTPEVAPVLVPASGGAIRDLISLAWVAGRRAFTRGSDRVELQDATGAVRELGQGHRLGLDNERVAALRALHRSPHTFAPSDKLSFELIETRRILHYASEDGERFVVHPVLRSMFEAEGRRP